VFDGASTVYNTDGLPVIMANANYQEELLVVCGSDFSKKASRKNRGRKNGSKVSGYHKRAEAYQ
jgi:hypothetical protein